MMTISENFPHIAQSVRAHETVQITGEVYVGEECKFDKNVQLQAKGGRLVIGDRTHVAQGSRVWSDEGRITIGKDVTIGENCRISAIIGNNTVIGSDVTIDSSNVIGDNCTIHSDQDLEDLSVPDGSTVEQGQIVE